jgi:hypothetical protein
MKLSQRIDRRLLMEYKIQVENEYVAVLLIEILFEKGLVNRQTYINAKKRLNSHISQTA